MRSDGTHTPGKSKARDAHRARVREQILDYATRFPMLDTYADDVAVKLGITQQAAVAALVELSRAGKVYRVRPSAYRPVRVASTQAAG